MRKRIKPCRTPKRRNFHGPKISRNNLNEIKTRNTKIHEISSQNSQYRLLGWKPPLPQRMRTVPRNHGKKNPRPPYRRYQTLQLQPRTSQIHHHKKRWTIRPPQKFKQQHYLTIIKTTTFIRAKKHIPQIKPNLKLPHRKPSQPIPIPE